MILIDTVSKEELDPIDYEGVLFANGFEGAFLGIGRQFNTFMAVYDYYKCIEILMEDGMSEEEAVEYFEFNTVGAYVGANTPIFLKGAKIVED